MEDSIAVSPEQVIAILKRKLADSEAENAMREAAQHNIKVQAVKFEARVFELETRVAELEQELARAEEAPLRWLRDRRMNAD